MTVIVAGCVLRALMNSAAAQPVLPFFSHFLGMRMKKMTCAYCLFYATFDPFGISLWFIHLEKPVQTRKKNVLEQLSKDIGKLNF